MLHETHGFVCGFFFLSFLLIFISIPYFFHFRLFIISYSWSAYLFFALPPYTFCNGHAYTILHLSHKKRMKDSMTSQAATACDGFFFYSSFFFFQLAEAVVVRQPAGVSIQYRLKPAEQPCAVAHPMQPPPVRSMYVPLCHP